MSAHTPGPWRVHICQFAKDGEACGIASPAWNPEKDSYPDVACDYSGDECHHMMTLTDAQLFSAAPELLAALKEAWEPWQTLIDQGKIGIGGWPASLARAKAAIDKAEGK